MNRYFALFFCIITLFGSSRLAIGADAAFSFETGLLQIPVVQVDNSSYYSAELTLTDLDSLQFELTSATEIMLFAAPDNPASFSFSTNQLDLPVVNVADNSYQVVMMLEQQGEVLNFTVSEANLLGVKPASLPNFDSVNLYSEASFFNQPIATSPAIDPNSDSYIDALADMGQFVVQVKQYSAPVYFADASTQRVNVSIECGPFWELGISQMLSVPIPDFAEAADDTDGAANPPVGCGEEADQDNHMIVLDPVNRCEYDFWQARKSGENWSASWGSAISMDSEGVYDKGMSTRGSGLAFLGGVIWPDELASGEIKHVVGFNAPLTRAGGPVAPASDTDGNTDSATALPEGAIIQLNPDIDLRSMNLTDYELTIAKAMQTYGLVLLDTGGATNLGLYVIDPKSVTGNPYENLLPEGDFVLLDNIAITPDNFRVLALPPQDADWTQNLGLADNACVQYQ